MIHRQAQWIVTTVSARNKENGYEKLTNNQPKPIFAVILHQSLGILHQIIAGSGNKIGEKLSN
jgi:hypothetical protein